MQVQSANQLSQVPLPSVSRGDEQGRSVSNSEKAAEAGLPPVATQSAQAVQALNPEQQARRVEDAVKKINETIKSMNQDVGLEFSTDEDTKIRVVKLVDIQSKEVLRQIPSEEVVNIAKAIDKLQGLLVREKA